MARGSSPKFPRQPLPTFAQKSSSHEQPIPCEKTRRLIEVVTPATVGTVKVALVGVWA
jgi:hypothetical protein